MDQIWEVIQKRVVGLLIHKPIIYIFHTQKLLYAKYDRNLWGWRTMSRKILFKSFLYISRRSNGLVGCSVDHFSTTLEERFITNWPTDQKKQGVQWKEGYLLLLLWVHSENMIHSGNKIIINFCYCAANVSSYSYLLNHYILSQRKSVS